jgi:large subunit ribosomal protein L18
MEKKTNRLRRSLRARSKIRELGVHRLTVHRTPRHIYAQVITPSGSEVVAAASTVEKAVAEALSGYSGNAASAAVVGRVIAERANDDVDDLQTGAYPNQQVSFSVSRGEILGFAGLVGAGRSEVAQAIFGVDPLLGGEVLLDGQLLQIHAARDAMSAGIYLIPEDRRRTGLVTAMKIGRAHV